MPEPLPLRIKVKADILEYEFFNTCDAFLETVYSDWGDKEKMEEMAYLDERIDWIYDELERLCEPLWSEQKDQYIGKWEGHYENLRVKLQSFFEEQMRIRNERNLQRRRGHSGR